MYIGLFIMACAMIGMLYVDAKVVPFLTGLLLAAVVGIAVMIFSDKKLTTIERKK